MSLWDVTLTIVFLNSAEYCLKVNKVFKLSLTEQDVATTPYQCTYQCNSFVVLVYDHFIKYLGLQHCTNIKRMLIECSACQFCFGISTHRDFRFPIPSRILKYSITRRILYLMRALFLHFYFAVFLSNFFQ